MEKNIAFLIIKEVTCHACHAYASQATPLDVLPSKWNAVNVFLLFFMAQNSKNQQLSEVKKFNCFLIKLSCQLKYKFAFCLSLLSVLPDDVL